MKVDIWSDVRCPFCYIGKHKFEKGLQQFPYKEKIEVVWHSFELDPYLKTDPSLNSLQYLAEKKGITLQEAEQMTQYVAGAAREIGLHFDSGRSVVANSFNAHRLIQLAKTKGLGNEAGEELFEAFFTDGKNIDDQETLMQIGDSIGLDPGEVERIFSSRAFEEAVRQDEKQAQTLGISGVPFFVFNNKYAVSGAQAPDIFLRALEKSWSEFEQADQLDMISEGSTCTTDGNCD